MGGGTDVSKRIDEDLDFIIAWVLGDIKESQIQKILDIKKSSIGGIMQASLKRNIRSGKIKLQKS